MDVNSFSDPRIGFRHIGVDGIDAIISVDDRGLMWTWMQTGKQTIRLMAVLEGDRVVFKGGRFGEHSLDAKLSSAERVIAHWRGYIQATEDVLIGYAKHPTPWAVQSCPWAVQS